MAASDHLGLQFRVQPGDNGGSVTAQHPLYGEVGRLGWSPAPGRGGAEVTSVHVAPRFRHQGIASEMYSRASDHAGQALSHSSYRTDDAEGWAQHVGGHMPDRVRVARDREPGGS